jgi:sec-independent protein translocase protein TatA
MHFPGLIPLLIVLFLAFLLFGRPGRLSGLMEDLGKGIKGFRKGLTEGEAKDEPPAADPPRQVIDQTAAEQASQANRDRAQN